MINPAIFRQYDIWEKDLTPEVVELLGRGYASYLIKSINRDKAKISVGGDARLHSPAIKVNLIVSQELKLLLMRASNTQPVLVLRFEAQNVSRLNEIKCFVEERLNKIIEEHKTA